MVSVEKNFLLFFSGGYFVAKGNPGHGSQFLPNTVGPKIVSIIPFG